VTLDFSGESWRGSLRAVVTLPEDFFQGLSNLTTILLDYTTLRNLPANIFQGVSNLKNLDMEGSNFDIFNTSFQSLQSLETITLRDRGEGVHRTPIPVDLFKGSPNLVSIDMYDSGFWGYWRNGEMIVELPENLLSGLSKLQSIDLGMNNLFDIPENVFRGLSALKYVSLKNNFDILFLPENIFEGLFNLSEVDLGGCGFNNLPLNIFQYAPNLTSIDLTNSGMMRSLLPRTFCGLSKLRTLSLDSHFDELEWLKSAKVPCDQYAPEIPDNFFESCWGLPSPLGKKYILKNSSVCLDNSPRDAVALYLSNIQVYSLPENLFQGLENLSLIDLSYNNLMETNSRKYFPRTAEFEKSEFRRKQITE
jgi:Leucine-rich repeat (LRR) protein